MKKLFWCLMVLAISIIFSSCSQRLLDFTLVSTKNVNLAEAHKSSTTRVKGMDRKHTIFFIPIGVPDIKEAIDKAIESVPGCVAIENGVIKSSFWWAVLYGQSKYIVEGTPVIKTSVASNVEKSDFQYVVKPAKSETNFVLKMDK